MNLSKSISLKCLLALVILLNPFLISMCYSDDGEHMKEHRASKSVCDRSPVFGPAGIPVWLARIRVGLSHVGQAFQPAISECRPRVAGWKACPT